MPRRNILTDRQRAVLFDLPTAQAEVVSCVDGPFTARSFLADVDHCGLRSCVRPVDAVHLTAGPDEVRLPGPNQTSGL